jgi:ribosomal protein L29
MLKINELQELDQKALLAKLDTERKELFDLRMQKKTMGLEKPHKLIETRKNIARIQTVLSMKGKA